MSKLSKLTKFALIGSIAAAGIFAYGCGGAKPVQQAMQSEAEKAKAEAEAKAKAEAERMKAEAETKAKAKAQMEAKMKAEAAKVEEEKMKAEAMAREARTYEITYFDYDKYNIRDDQKPVVAKNADKLKAHPELKATLEGHCDERGTVEYNIALGQKRADSVKGFLLKAGVGADRIKTVSYGKERPVDMGHSETAWAKNRRVEVVAAP